jgi:hypothetical protein
MIPADPRSRLELDAGSAALLFIVPQLLGHIPCDQVVLIGTRPPGHQQGAFVTFALPSLADQTTIADLARQNLAALAGQQIHQFAAIGYGPPETTTPVIHAVLAEAASAQLQVATVIHVSNDHHAHTDVSWGTSAGALQAERQLGCLPAGQYE